MSGTVTVGLVVEDIGFCTDVEGRFKGVSIIGSQDGKGLTDARLVVLDTSGVATEKPVSNGKSVSSNRT